MKPEGAILLCTLGGSWAVIPEIYGFVAPSRLPLYENHPRRQELIAMRRELPEPEAIWVLTTDSASTRNSIEILLRWWAGLGCPGGLRVWVLEGTEQLSDPGQCYRMREGIARLFHRASLEGPVLASLAGGRKTMSSDLQRAANWFGCRALLHVVAPDALPERLKEPETFLRPLDPGDAGLLQPLVVGRTQRAEFLDLPSQRLDPGDYPFPALPEGGEPVVRVPAEVLGGPALAEELEERSRQAYRLMSGFFEEVRGRERHQNWLSLYRLPPARLSYLRETRLAPLHRPWLEGLPLAELHCHLGGILDLPRQKRVARALWEALPRKDQDLALERVRPFFDEDRWDWDWPRRLRIFRSACAAALLIFQPDSVLEDNLWGSTEPRRGLRRRGLGFDAYERPGELTGSALLGHEAAVEEYARAVCEVLHQHRVRYCELRGSPHKYLRGNGLRFLERFREAVDRYRKGCHVRFLWICDRRQPVEQIAKIVEAAVEAWERHPDFVVGLDLAGDEEVGDPEALAAAFRPAFERCLKITVHAGEGQRVERIWGAAYHLQADRIGHGLTLGQRQDLARRFRDRGIAVELCPTSNLEWVGYRDPEDPTTGDWEEYPLRRLLDLGIRVALCTDNPGISRTTLAQEYLVASRLVGGLTLWEVLSLTRQSLCAAFLSGDERERLLKEWDGEVFRYVTDTAPDEGGRRLWA